MSVHEYIVGVSENIPQVQHRLAERVWGEKITRKEEKGERKEKQES
jgi:hypothetical protein